MTQDKDGSPALIDLITGTWRCQIVFAATAIGVFDALDPAGAVSINGLAGRLGVDEPALYRLLRALASLGLLREQEARHFEATPTGDCLRRDHPHSLRAMALLEAGPVHAAAWKHLEDIVRTGRPDGFRREYGALYFDYLRRDPTHARIFSEAMSSYSALEAPAVGDAYRAEHFGAVTFCDIGGSEGRLLAQLLQDHPEAQGIVFDLPEVIDLRDNGAVAQTGLGTRLTFAGGNMFTEVPAANVYILKHILHGWPDEDCATILSVARRAARPGARLLICEMLVPGPETAHFAKLIDVHMMVVQNGRQRTQTEISALLERSGWRSGRLRPLGQSPLSVLEAEVSDC